MSRRVTLPLNKKLAADADDDFYSAHPELVKDGKRIPLDPNDPAQIKLRSEWIQLYVDNGGAVKEISHKKLPTATKSCPEGGAARKIPHEKKKRPWAVASRPDY